MKKEYLDDLYKLGIIQGEHNINWTDEYSQLEHSKNYYQSIKKISDKYAIKYDFDFEDLSENENKWDESASHMLEILKEYIIKQI